MFYSVSTETKQMILNHFLDKIFSLFIKQCFLNFDYDLVDLVHVQLKM